METTQKFKFHVIKERPQSSNLPVVPSPAELGGVVLYHIYIFNNPDLKETSLYLWDGKRLYGPFTGSEGPRGEMGPQGLRGEIGPQGDAMDFDALTEEQKAELRGLPGPKGEKGERGEKGDRGMAGPPGKDGEKGEPGKDGEKGERGSKGEKGERGEKGDRGMQGTSGILIDSWDNIEDIITVINEITPDTEIPDDDAEKNRVSVVGAKFVQTLVRDIAELKSGVVYCTEEEFESWQERGELVEGVEYNIYEE